MQIEFLFPQFFLLLLLVFLMYIFKQQKHNSLHQLFSKHVLQNITTKATFSLQTQKILLFSSLLFLIVALCRPVINNGKIEVDSITTEVVVAFDISYSMQANDVFPNRFDFAKQKFIKLLDTFKEVSFGVEVFAGNSYLISPITKDLDSLKFLVENISLDYISRNGTNILSSLNVANDLQQKSKEKNILIFTDGGDNKDFSKEIEYVIKNNIKVFVYAIGSKEGSVIKKIDNTLIKDENGNLVITKLNNSIKTLAVKSKGAYLEYSLDSNDITKIVSEIKSNTKEVKKQSVLKDIKELFYYPLLLSIFLFVILRIKIYQ